MNNDFYKKIETISLLVAIVCLTIGFMSYSSSLQIVEDLEVKEENKTEKVKIVFSAREDRHDVKVIEGITGSGESVGTVEIVDTEKGTLTNLHARFTKPGQRVSYVFYSHNLSKEDAYLDTITYSNVSGDNNFKKCYALNSRNTNLKLLTAACADISMIVYVNDIMVTNGSLTGIEDHLLKAGTSEKVTVIIEYADNGNFADEDFVVEFGSLTLTYLSKEDLKSR